MEKSEDEEKATAESEEEEERSTIGVTHTRRCCCSHSCRALIWPRHICVRDFSHNSLAF